MKEKLLIEALQKKLYAGSGSINVLIHMFKKNFPVRYDLVMRINKANLSFGTADEINDKDLLELINDIKQA